MYSSMGTVCAAFPSDTRDDDGGYPTVCLSQDLNGPDMICANNGYNWFSVSSEYSDRYATYANPFARYAIFYNQIKAANDIILSIDPATASETEKYYLGQAKAVRAFDYLCLAPYYQFRYATSKDLPCVPLITEETTNFVNNPRATVGKVYEQIISDLNSAIDLLEGYNRQGDKTRIDQQVAYGLRARAHLYMGMWQEAYNDADKAMEGYTPYTKEEVSKPAFYDISDHNWMWGINVSVPMVNKNAYATPAGQLGSFSSYAYTAGVAMYKTINSLLYKKISTSDVRKQWWVDELRHGLFLSFAVICAVGLCFVMLKLMADVKEGKNEVSTLQSQLNEQLNVNAEYSSGLDSMTDLDEIYKIATTELGMVYSKPGQTVYYPQNSDDYVIQYKNVPETK